MADFFRRALIGGEFAVRLARMQPRHTSSAYADLVEKDVARSFPKHPVVVWKKEITVVLNRFASQHSIGYVQGMNFLASGLFWVYVQDCPQHAVEDTVYSLPRLLRICLPLYPMNAEDRGPLRFCRAVAQCIGHTFSQWDENLQSFCEIFILHFWPPLFGNMFSLDESLTLWHFFMEADTDRERYARLFVFTVEMIRVHEKLFSLGGPRAFTLLSDRAMHRMEGIIERARVRGREGSWLSAQTT